MLPKVRIVIPWQALLGLVALVFMGHACTQAIKEGQDFSSVGIQYADAMTELIELTTDTVIDDDKYQYRIAGCYYKLLQLEQAKIEYQALIERYPASDLVDDSYFQLAAIMQSKGQLPEAERVWRNFLVRYPEGELFLDAKFNLAGTLEEEEKLEESLELYQEVFDKYDNKETVSWRIEKVRDRIKSRGR